MTRLTSKRTANQTLNSPIELLESIGRIEGNPVLVASIARLAARHICPKHSDVIEVFASNPPP